MASNQLPVFTLQNLAGMDVVGCPTKEQLFQIIEGQIRGQKVATDKFLPTAALISLAVHTLEEIENAQNGNKKSPSTATAEDGSELSKGEKAKHANWVHWCKENITKDSPLVNHSALIRDSAFYGRISLKGRAVPMLPREVAYEVLVAAHTSEGMKKGTNAHSGNNATFDVVKTISSSFKKELVRAFVDACPTCSPRVQSAREAHQKRKPNAAKNGGVQAIIHRRQNKINMRQQAAAVNPLNAVRYPTPPGVVAANEIPALPIQQPLPYFDPNMAAQPQQFANNQQQPHELAPEQNYGGEPQWQQDPEEAALIQRIRLIVHPELYNNFEEPMPDQQAMPAAGQHEHNLAQPEPQSLAPQQQLPAGETPQERIDRQMDLVSELMTEEEIVHYEANQLSAERFTSLLAEAEHRMMEQDRPSPPSLPNNIVDPAAVQAPTPEEEEQRNWRQTRPDDK